MIELAWTVFWLSPVVALFLFRNLEVPLALSVALIGTYLFLPRGLAINFPVLPSLDRTSLPVFAALLFAAVALTQKQQQIWRLPGWAPASPAVWGFLAILFLGVFGTVFTNPDELVYGWRHLRGLQIYDGFSVSLGLLVMLIPFFLGRMVLSSPGAQKIFLQVLVCAALVYSVPTLWEVRMSPQLHGQIYGYVPFSFAQQIRESGFRPVVFLSHGLELSIFLTLSIIAAAALMRAAEPGKRLMWGLSALWLFGVLVLSKSLGALVIAVFLVPVVLFLRPRTQLLIAFCLAVTVLTYPVLRAVDLVPVDQAVALAERIDPVRAGSLATRIHNEDALLAHARERPLFGWGGWGRQRIFAADGTDISLTDGYWVIQMGSGGWVRYIGVFGLLCWPLLMIFFRRRDDIDPICIGFVFILCAKLLDFIPNSGMMPVVWLVTGGLVGRLERRAQDEAARPQAETAQPEGPVYTRQTARHSRYARKGAAPAAASGTEPSYVRPGRSRGYRR